MGIHASAAPTLVYLASNTCLNSSRSWAELLQSDLLQRQDGFEPERFRFVHGMIRHAVCPLCGANRASYRTNRQVPRHRVQRAQRWVLGRQPVDADLEQPGGAGQIPRNMLAEVDQLGPCGVVGGVKVRRRSSTTAAAVMELRHSDCQCTTVNHHRSASHIRSGI